jgi:hypothetical protein
VYVKQTDIGWLCDREALAVWLGRSTETIRRRVPVVGYLGSGEALHNMEQASVILAEIPSRRRIST